jgi:hypothetical protein
MEKNSTLPSKILALITLMICILSLPAGLRAEQLRGDEISMPASEQAGAAKIQFDALSYDFGKVFQNKSLEHIFSFKNEGTGNLHIIKVKAG